MNAVDLVLELYQRDISLKVEEEHLRYRAKVGRLTPELKEAMLKHKTALVKLLSAPPPCPENYPELNWRIEAMRAQIPPTGAIPFLLARPNVQIGHDTKGKCGSCG